MRGPITGKRPDLMGKFFVIFSGQGISLFGSQLVQFALVWWLTKASGSASVLALASIVALLPQIVVSPFVGPLIDRWSRRTVMMVADAVIALAVVALAVLYAWNAVEIWHIYALMLIRAAGAAFHWPAMQASTTLMVPDKHLSRVAGLNQSLQGLANITAPPLGAFLLEILPMQNILAIDVATAIIAITPLFLIPIPQPLRAETPEKAQPSPLADLHAALRYMWAWKGGMFILIGAMMINLLAVPAFSLLPILATNHFGGGAYEFAWLQSAMGIGTVLGGLTLGVWGGFKKRIVTGMLALILAGISITVVGITPATLLMLAVAAMFSAGFMLPITNGSLFAILQTTVPPDMQGRVFTLLMSGAVAMTPLGLAIAGPVADSLGVQAWFLVGGIAMIAIGTTAFFTPPIMRIEEKTSQNVTMTPSIG